MAANIATPTPPTTIGEKYNIDPLIHSYIWMPLGFDRSRKRKNAFKKANIVKENGGMAKFKEAKFGNFYL
jgi:hypothetical protein